jgi:hypothetical protein
MDKTFDPAIDVEQRAREIIKNEGHYPTDVVTRSVEDGFHIPFVGAVVFDYFKNSPGNILTDF